MANLFSIFDPTLSLFSLSWTVSLLALIFVPFSYWGAYSFCSVWFFGVLNSSIKEISYVLPAPMKGVLKFVVSVFLTICLYNFLSLFPHIFSATSHLLVTLPFSYTFWLGVILFSWVKSFSNFLSHLIPVGTPVGLMSFMVVVELLSNFIRPLALTFRLTANMMAGHLLMSLIGVGLISLPLFPFILGSMVQSLLVFMELGVSLIQGYVFSTLLLLYLSEGESG